MKGAIMDDDLMYKLYDYIDILRYNPEVQTSRGAIASEIEIILNTKFANQKTADLYKKLIICRKRCRDTKENVV